MGSPPSKCVACIWQSVHRTDPLLQPERDCILADIFLTQPVNMKRYLHAGLKRFKGQDDGEGILHQVAQFPIELVYLHTRCPYPSLPTQDPERQGTGCRAGRLIHPSKSPTRSRKWPVPAIIAGLVHQKQQQPCSERPWNMWAVNNYQSLSHNATKSLCPQNVTRQSFDIQVPN